MPNTILDEFGRRLMVEVRDESITDWRMILSSEMQGERADRIRSILSDLDSSALDLAVPEIVDTVLFHLLRWLEEDDDFRIAAAVEEGSVHHLAEESDGLSGELFSDRGWISRFSASTL